MANPDRMLTEAARLYPNDVRQILYFYRSAVMLRHLSWPVKILALQTVLFAVLFLVA